MFTRIVKQILVAGTLLLLFLLTACDTTGNANTAQSTQNQSHTPPVVVSTSVSTGSTPGIGPILILSPTPVPGGNSHGQLVTLSDRTLIISSVSKVAGIDSDSTGISITMTMKNTAGKSLVNQASYFQLVGAEGDTFGLQSSASTSFFGLIQPRASRSGTIIFQVPTAALKGLRLLFRSDVATETVFISLNV